LYQVNEHKIIQTAAFLSKGGLAHPDNKKNWIFKQLELIAQKFNFKPFDPLSDCQKRVIQMILYGGRFPRGRFKA
jgi:excinuclease ABC subunit A